MDTLTIWAGERDDPAYYGGTFSGDGKKELLVNEKEAALRGFGVPRRVVLTHRHKDHNRVVRGGAMCCQETRMLGLPAEVIEALAHYRRLLDERGWDWGDEQIRLLPVGSLLPARTGLR